MTAPKPPGAGQWAQNMVALYVALLRSRTHFAQAVYGDGEWKNILGKGEGTNDQGEAYCDELGAALRRTLTDDVGQWNVLWPGRAGASIHAAAERWVREHAPRTVWLPFRPLSWAGVMGLLRPFLKEVRRHRVVLVGPQHFKALDPAVLDPAVRITVPDGTAWQEAEATARAVYDVLEDDDLVFFSSGQASCLSIHALWPDVQSVATLIDTGSMWDPYCGVNSRRVYTTDHWKKVRRLNIP